MSFEITTGDKIHRLPQRELDTVVDRILPVGACLLTGDPKAGKTTLISQISHAVVTGKPVFGEFSVARKGKVLYFALDESQAETRERQHRIDDDATAWSDVLYVYSLGEVRPGESFVSALQAMLSESKYESVVLVVIDIFQCVRGPRAGNDVYAGDYAATTPFSRIANDLNVAIVIVHHNNKGYGDGQSRISGSNGLPGGATATLTLTKSQAGMGKVRIAAHSMPDYCHFFRMSESGLWTYERSTVAGGGSTSKPKQRDRVLAALPDVEFTASDIAKKLRMSAGTVRRSLSELDGNAITRVKRGVYQRKSSSARTVSFKENSERTNGVAA